MLRWRFVDNVPRSRQIPRSHRVIMESPRCHSERKLPTRVMRVTKVWIFGSLTVVWFGSRLLRRHGDRLSSVPHLRRERRQAQNVVPLQQRLALQPGDVRVWLVEERGLLQVGGILQPQPPDRDQQEPARPAAGRQSGQPAGNRLEYDKAAKSNLWGLMLGKRAAQLAQLPPTRAQLEGLSTAALPSTASSNKWLKYWY